MGQFKDVIVSGDARIVGSIFGDLIGNASNASNASVANNALKVNNHTVEKDVPSNAIFTDTKYNAGSGITLLGTTFSLDSNASVFDNNINWGGINLAGKISPADAGCIDEFGHNKLAFLPPECVTVEYTTDGGETWIDYGLSDAAKTNLTTLTGNSCVIGKGIATAQNGLLTADNCTDYQVRVTICSRDKSNNSKLYTQLRKILINVSTNGATGSHVLVERRSIGDYNNNIDNWIKLGDYKVEGWSGWNSIPYETTFGGGANQTSNPAAELRFTFGITGINPAYVCTFNVSDIRFIGLTNWTTPSEMARVGHLYKVTADQSALFPLGISPETNNTAYLGVSNRRWRGIYGTNLYVNGVVQIGDTQLDEAKLKKLLSLIE